MCIYFNINTKPLIIYNNKAFYTFSSIYSGFGDFSFESIYNSAFLAEINNNTIGINTYNLYVLNNISNSNIFGVYSNKYINVLSSFNLSQSPSIKTYEPSICVSKKINNNFNIGLSFNYFYMDFLSIIPSKKTFYICLNTIYKINENLLLSIKLDNPIGGYINYISNEKLSNTFILGASYLKNKINFISEFYKEEDKDIYYNGALFVKFNNSLNLGVGYVTNYSKPYLISKFIIKENLHSRLNFDYHPYLGLSSGISISYTFNKKS